MKAIVKFSFGVAHPLYNKAVEAEIYPCSGYNGRCVFGEAVEPVLFPEDPEGLLVYDKDYNFVGYKTKPAEWDKVDGWVKEVWSDKYQKWLTANEFSEMVYMMKKQGVDYIMKTHGVNISNKL